MAALKSCGPSGRVLLWAREDESLWQLLLGFTIDAAEWATMSAARFGQF